MGVHDEFAGVIGRDWRDSTPWWPPEPEPPDGRAERRAASCSTTSASRSSAATAPTSTRPNIDGLAADGRAARQLPHHRALLADPRRACSPAATTTRNGMGRVADLAIGLPRLLRARSRARTASSPRSCARDGLRDVRGRQVAPHARRRDAHGRDRASWPLGRGFDRWYGFHGGETHQFVPTLYRDNHAVQPPRTTDEGYHLSEDLADRAIEYLARPPRGRRASSRSSSTSRPARATRRTTRRRSGSSATAASSTTGWDAWRERDVRAPARARASCPPGTELSPRPPWVPAWDDLEPEDQAVAARFMECFAAFLSHTDAQIGRVLELPRARPATLDNTIVVARVRQRRERRGRRARLDQRRAAWGTATPAGRTRAARPHRRARRPDRAQQLPVGLDDGRQHAVPALEARGARGRRRRPVHRALAGALRRRRRRRSATSSRTRSTCCRRCSS